MSERMEFELLQEDLLEVKKKLFVDSAPRKPSQNSTIKKAAISTPILQTPTKKIRLRRHLKTEIASTTPRGVRQARMKTSPNGRSPLQRINELKISKFKDHPKAIKESPIAEQYRIDNSNKPHYPQIATSFEVIYPSPKRSSLAYNSIYKESLINRSISKSQQKNLLSKSRKKKMFTVFQTNKKSVKKEEKLAKSQKIEYQMPFRYHSSLTINLFDSSISKNHNRSKSKSLSKGMSSQKKELSSNKKSKALRSLLAFQDERIAKVLCKIQKFKFVFEYMSRNQIIEKFKCYAFQNEPECKWPLLVVDEVFKRKRQEQNASFS